MCAMWAHTFACVTHTSAQAHMGLHTCATPLHMWHPYPPTHVMCTHVHTLIRVVRPHICMCDELMCVHIHTCMCNMYVCIHAHIFLNHLHISWSVIPKYFSIYFLRKGTYSYLYNNSYQIYHWYNNTSLYHLHFTFISWPNDVLYNIFFPFTIGSSLGLGITFNFFSLIQSEIFPLPFCLLDIITFKEYSSPPLVK